MIIAHRASKAFFKYWHSCVIKISSFSSSGSSIAFVTLIYVPYGSAQRGINLTSRFSCIISSTGDEPFFMWDCGSFRSFIVEGVRFVHHFNSPCVSICFLVFSRKSKPPDFPSIAQLWRIRCTSFCLCETRTDNSSDASLVKMFRYAQSVQQLSIFTFLSVLVFVFESNCAVNNFVIVCNERKLLSTSTVFVFKNLQRFTKIKSNKWCIALRFINAHNIF